MHEEHEMQERQPLPLKILVSLPMRAETVDHQLEELLVAGVELDLAAQLHPADVLQYKYSKQLFPLQL